MSTDLLQQRPRGFLQSEAEFARSRDRVCVGVGAGFVPAGMVLGKSTATGKYYPSPVSAIDGTDNAIAIALYDADASLGDVVATVINRDAEARYGDLLYDVSVVTFSQQQAKWAQLLTVGIVVRWLTAITDVQVPENE